MNQLAFKRLHPDAIMPSRGTEQAAGFDLYACIKEPVELYPGQRKLVPTGIAISLPAGMAALVTPRSGLAIKNGITVLNAPGLVDPDYRGDIGVELFNAADIADPRAYRPFIIEPGMRIAQLVLTPFFAPEWVEVESLDETERGSDGFGSTGVHLEIQPQDGNAIAATIKAGSFKYSPEWQP